MSLNYKIFMKVSLSFREEICTKILIYQKVCVVVNVCFRSMLEAVKVFIQEICGQLSAVFSFASLVRFSVFSRDLEMG